MNDIPAPVVLDREELGEQLIVLLHAGFLEASAIRIMAQGLPESLFVKIREILEDLGSVVQPGDDAAIERTFRDRAARRGLLEAMLAHARTH